MKKLNVFVVCQNDGINRITTKTLSALKFDYSVLDSISLLANSIQEQSPDVVIVHETYLKNPAFINELCNDELGSSDEPGVIVLTESALDAEMLCNLNGVVCDFLSIPFTIDLLWKKLKKANEQRAFSAALKTWMSETRSAHTALRNQMFDFMDHLNVLASKDDASLNSPVNRKDDHLMHTLRPILNSLLDNAHRDPSLKRYEPQFRLLKDCIEDFGIEDCTENLASSAKLDIVHDHGLSKKELRIMAMIKVGMTTEEIADRLNIASDTVKTHRRNIRKKLELVGNKCNLNAYLQAI